MNLGFMQKWPQHMGQWGGQPTYFIDKIWTGLLDNELADLSQHNDYLDKFSAKFENGFWDAKSRLWERPYASKLHTFREDPNDRWKPGMKIHPAIGIRTKNYFQFAPVMPCVSTQKVEIRDISDTHSSIGIVIEYPTKIGVFELRWSVKIDGRELSPDEIKKLAINDGFESVEHFFTWFNKSAKYKLIHWTPLRY